MMKLACMSLSYQRAFRAGQMDLFAFIDACRAHNLDGVDLNANSFPQQDQAFLTRLKWHAIQRGLPIACLSIPNNFGAPREGLEAEIARTKGWIDAALLLGAPQTRVFMGTVPAGADEATLWRQAVAALKEVADYGHDRGVMVSLQNHNHGALTKYGDDILRAVAEAGPHLSHVWDTGQYVGSPGASGADREQGGQEVLYQSLQATVRLATHVRCKFYRNESGQEAWLDYPRIFRMLHAAGYNGFCSIVYEGPGDEEAAVARAIAQLRALMPSA